LRGGPWAKKKYGVFDRALDAEATGCVGGQALRPLACAQGTMTLTGLGDGVGVVRRNATKACLALEKITVLVSNPVANGVGTCKPTMLPGNNLWGNATLVRTVWACTMTEEGEDDLGVTIGGGKMKRCGT
jgi:hypothetical protein